MSRQVSRDNIKRGMDSDVWQLVLIHVDQIVSGSKTREQVEQWAEATIDALDVSSARKQELLKKVIDRLDSTLALFARLRTELDAVVRRIEEEVRSGDQSDDDGRGLASLWEYACRIDDAMYRIHGYRLLTDRERIEEEVGVVVTSRMALAERRRDSGRAARIDRRPVRAQPETVTCAEEDCKRGRVFFDEAGVGYCKRHGNERGLRPRGKVI